ncbi:P-loop containing nucleoside triphosphate hydrolase protein [Aspergillus oleicola]
MDSKGGPGALILPNSGFQVGISHGPIYLPAEQPEPRPEPLSTVPFPHDADFVSRDGVLDQIHEKSSIPGSRIVLVGLGGVGKSRLAIEYCHQVHASNAARCEKSLHNLANHAKIPGRQDRNANIFQLFGSWLQDGKMGEWILVLDNPPLRYLLENSNGSIIVTSRKRAVALEIAGHKKNMIDVQPMNVAEALDLLQKKLDLFADKEDLVQLVEELKFMPLAIVQAASYITHCSPRCSASQYLEKLRQSNHQTKKLLYHEAHHTHRDWESRNSILLTWQISFDHIRRIRQSAADLLSLMSFFDWQGIQEDLLRIRGIERNYKPIGSLEEVVGSSCEGDTDSSSEYEQDDDFETDITTLRDYSFIATNEDSTVFTMHRLVQLTVRTWLKAHGQDEMWKNRFISDLHGEFPTGEYEYWERCRSLFPHVRSAALHRPKSEDSLRNWAAPLYRGAWYALECGNISDTKDMAARSRKEIMKIGGAEDEDALKSTAMLAVAYRREGKWEEAEQLEVQVMEMSKTKLGADHPNTLASMGNLAATYMSQGRWDEAEQLLVQVMETSKTKLGVDHPDTLTSMGNLAATYMVQGRWEEAEQLEVQV